MRRNLWLDIAAYLVRAAVIAIVLGFLLVELGWLDADFAIPKVAWE